GHLPVVSYLAIPVMSRNGEVLGGLFFGHHRPGVFSQEAEDIAIEIATMAGLTFDNARLHDGMGREIERRKAAEETKELLLQEIKHRAKNLLATIEVIAAQSLHEISPESRRQFIARIRTIAGTHDLLTNSDWKFIQLTEVVKKGLAAFDNSRITA